MTGVRFLRSSVALLVLLAVSSPQPSPAQSHAVWIDDGVVYALTPWLFAGEDFTSMISRLDTIEKLGANILWLSPVTEAPDKDFGYAVTDPFALRHIFGTDTEFRALLSAAHAHGLRVMLDEVTNHLARASCYFADTQRRGRQSPYYSWFERDARGAPVHYFDWVNLENLNYADPQVRSFTLAALEHWVRDYPVDGLRLDAIWALRQRAPRWLARIKPDLERIKPDIALLAEASARDSYYSSHGFDAAYDWTVEPGHWAWQDIFGPPGTTADLPRLRQALQAEREEDRRPLRVLHYLNDNDTGKRFITRHGPQQTRVAAVLLFTLPGLPLIYAGDEVGAEFEPYATKAPLDWSDRHHLEPLYERLVQLRHRNRALRDGRMVPLTTDQDASVLAFARLPVPGANADRPWLVVLNLGPSPVRVRVQSVPHSLLGHCKWSALNPFDATLHSMSPSPQIRLELQGYGAWLLYPGCGARE